MFTFVYFFTSILCHQLLQRFDAVGFVAERASGLNNLLHPVFVLKENTETPNLTQSKSSKPLIYAD